VKQSCFDEIAGAVASDLETQVRVELAHRIAASGLPIRRTARRLAFDVIEVARPVIERSSALTQGDLVDVIQQTTQDHMMAVTKRSDIGEKVSSALVAKGGDSVVASLLQNSTTKLRRETFERVADRASSVAILQAPFVRRQNVPLDLLNAIYLKVSTELRRDIITKFEGASLADFEAALEEGRDLYGPRTERCLPITISPRTMSMISPSATPCGRHRWNRCCVTTSEHRS
jgi:uncharacterized protein (DUF2336 family)